MTEKYPRSQKERLPLPPASLRIGVIPPPLKELSFIYNISSVLSKYGCNVIQPGFSSPYIMANELVQWEVSNLISKYKNPYEIYGPPSGHMAWSKPYFIWNQTPDDFAHAILEMLERPNLDALISSGGAGTQEAVYILATRHKERIKTLADEVASKKRQPIPLFGFSDASHLLHYLGGLGIVSPMVLRCASLYNKDLSAHDTALEIKSVVTGKMQETTELIPLNDMATKPGARKGQLTFYQNMHNLYTPYGMYAGDGANFLLMESGHRGAGTKDGEGLRSNLRRLKAMGKLKCLDAIILSRCDADGSTQTPLERINLTVLRDVIKDELDNSIPVYFGAPLGHPAKDEPPLHAHALPLLTNATLFSDGRKTQLISHKHRTPESIEDIRKQYEKQMASPLRFPPLRRIAPLFQPLPEEEIQPPYLNDDFRQVFEEGCFACKLHQDPFLKGCLPEGLRGYGTELKGKNLLLVYDPAALKDASIANIEDITINDLQMSLTELLMRGELQHLQSLIIAVPNYPYEKQELRSISWGVTHATEEFLDYYSRYFPEVPVGVINISPEIAERIPSDRPVEIRNRQKGYVQNIIKGSDAGWARG